MHWGSVYDKIWSMFCSPSLNICVALAKILVSYALGIFGGALVQSQIMGQGLGEPHSAHLISLNRTIPMLMRTKIIHICRGRDPYFVEGAFCDKYDRDVICG